MINGNHTNKRKNMNSYPDPIPRKAYHQWMDAGSAFAKAVIQDSEREDMKPIVDGCCKHGELIDKYCAECAKEDKEAEESEKEKSGFHQTVREHIRNSWPFKPKIVCLCGSTKFKDDFIKANFEETMRGNIVLTVGWFSHEDKETYYPTPEEKRMLDALHFAKIAISDEILVINIDGYIGVSTCDEIGYAMALGKTVRFLCDKD
jgi:hypothetical protein